MKEIMTLHIHLHETVEVTSDQVKVVQISFTGTAEGEYFQGEILPGAVDTQTVYPDGTGRLSARYTLRGTDAASSNETPCFSILAAFLFSSHSKCSVLIFIIYIRSP